MLRISNYPSTLHVTPAESETVSAPTQPPGILRDLAIEHGPRIVAEVARALESTGLEASTPLGSALAQTMCEDCRSTFSGVNVTYLLCLSATRDTKDFQAVAQQVPGFDTKVLTPDARASIDKAFSEKLNSTSNDNRDYVDLHNAQKMLKEILAEWRTGHRAYLPVDRHV